MSDQFFPDAEKDENQSSVPFPDQIQNLLQSLDSEDEMEVLASLSQLTTSLSMSAEESYSSLPIESLMTSLINCLNRAFPDISLYAIMSINCIFDSVPNSVNIFSNAGGITPLCSKLTNFEYIDMAEHAIKTLQRLSYDHPSQILNEGIFAPLIGMMDFFEKSTQSKIINCAITLASTVSSEDLFLLHILPVVPVLSNSLQYKGSEFIENNKAGLRFFSVLSEAILRFSGEEHEKSRRNLESIAEHGMINNLIELISVSNDFKLQCFQLIRRLCENSPKFVYFFNEIGGISIVNQVLTSESPQGELPPYYIEAITLVEALLPKNNTDFDLLNYYSSQNHLLDSFREIIFPRILPIYEQSVNKSVRHTLLNIINKIIQYSNENFTLTGISPAEFACFTSEVINSRNIELIRALLTTVLLLYEKIPNEVAYSFLREGLPEKIDELLQIETVKDMLEIYKNLQEFVNLQGTDLRNVLLRAGVSFDSFMIEEFLKYSKENSEEIKESSEKIEGNIEKIEGNIEGNIEKIEANVEKIEGNIEKIEGNIEKIEGNIEKIEGNIEKIEGNIEKVEGNIEKIEGNIEKIEGNIEKVERKTKSFEVACEIAIRELGKIGNAIKDKIQQFFKPEATRILIELREIVKQIESGVGSESFSKLKSIFDEGVTLHEIVSSNLIPTLWGFLTADYLTDPKLSLSRVFEFLTRLKQENGHGKTFFEVFTSTLVNLLNYIQNFSILIPEVSMQNPMLTLKSITSRVKLTLVYSPQSDLEILPEILPFHTFFTSINSFSVTIPAYHTFLLVAQGLLKINTEENLQCFINCFTKNNSENREINQAQVNMIREGLKLQHFFLGIFNFVLESPEKNWEKEENKEEEENEAQVNEETIYLDLNSDRSKEIRGIDVKFCVESEEISNNATIFEVNRNYETESGLVVKFWYEKSSSDKISRKVSLFPNETWQNLLSEALDLKVTTCDKAFLPICTLKLLNLLNKNIENFLSDQSILFPSASTSPLRLNSSNFISPKLSALLGKQISDFQSLITGFLPEWVKFLPLHSPHLFNFTQRTDFFASNAFSGGRSLYFYPAYRKSFSVKIPRQKAMVPREKLLEFGMKIFKNVGFYRFGLLEFDFEGEEGTGIGPTLEFYTLISNEIRKLNVWRDFGLENGLFPAPIQSQDPQKTEETFEFIGKIVAKALYDDRLINLPFSTAFWKLFLGKTVSILDLKSVDASLGNYMIELFQLVKAKQLIVEEHKDPDVQTKHLKKLELKGVRVEDLNLFFTLPGYNQIELKPNGKNIQVTIENLENYLQLVTEMTLLQTLQISAFKRGFETLIPSVFLNVFDYEEFELVVCGKSNESWEINELNENIVPAHGYSRESVVFKNLLETMNKFNAEERKNFLQFVTGCPRLPIGGFKALNPPLTVVRKAPTDFDICPDFYLPSVMTCQNYLKLPEYSNIQILDKQIKYAFNEAKETFHLS